MSVNQIPVLDLKPQYQKLKSEIQAAINAVLESGQFILGQTVQTFEEKVAAYLGVKHAVGVNSGTDALMISLRACGVSPGDEVITTPFSFFATAESISNIGAKPVFVDVDAQTFNLNPKAIKQVITPRTKAILPVHLFGLPVAMDQILKIAQAHDLKVIEDCAQSFGARYSGNCITSQEDCQQETRTGLQGKLTGALGHAGAFSFFPTKNLGAYGDGGLIVTDDDQIVELARMLRVHGSKKRYHNEVFGYNSRLDALQAAILQVKLSYVDQWNQDRRRVAQTYNDLLANVPSVVTPPIADGHVFHQYTIRVLDGQRDRLYEALRAQGIGCMIYYPIPQDLLPVYKGQYPTNPVSEQLATEVLSLPMWPELATETIEIVVAAIKQVLKL